MGSHGLHAPAAVLGGAAEFTLLVVGPALLALWGSETAKGFLYEAVVHDIRSHVEAPSGWGGCNGRERVTGQYQMRHLVRWE